MSPNPDQDTASSLIPWALTFLVLSMWSWDDRGRALVAGVAVLASAVCLFAWWCIRYDTINRRNR